MRKRDHSVVDFDKSTAESELADANPSQQRSSELLAAALKERRLRALATKPHEALDPDVSDLTWGVRSGGLYLKRGSRIVRR